MVFVSGEAGIGKSALVEGLRAQVRAEGLPRMAFRCSPYHTTSVLYPVITHLERLLQMYQAMDMMFWLPQTETARAQVDA